VADYTNDPRVLAGIGAALPNKTKQTVRFVPANPTTDPQSPDHRQYEACIDRQQQQQH
jgi:hypothetical protein